MGRVTLDAILLHQQEIALSFGFKSLRWPWKRRMAKEQKNIISAERRSIWLECIVSGCGAATNVVLAFTLIGLLDLTVADRLPMIVKAERVTWQRPVADDALSDCQSLLCDRLSDNGFQSQTFRIDPEISKDRRSSAMNRRGQIESFCHRFLSAFSSRRSSPEQRFGQKRESRPRRKRREKTSS